VSTKDDARAAKRSSSFERPTASSARGAFLIAATVCYIPANVLPVLTTTTAAGAESDTILQGVVLLWVADGMAAVDK